MTHSPELAPLFRPLRMAGVTLRNRFAIAFTLSFIKLGMVVLDVLNIGTRRGFFNIFLRTDLHGEQGARYFLAHQIKQTLEEFKGFALVFLLRILLGITAQMDTLTQMVQC